MNTLPKRARATLINALALLFLCSCSSQAEDRAQYAALDLPGFNQALQAARGKVLLVCFWATQCPACRTELPELEKLQAAYPDGRLTVLTVALDESAAAVKAFFGRKTPGLAVRMGSAALAQAYDVRYIPKIVIFGKSGQEAFNQSGLYPYPMLDRIVKKLVEGS